MKNYATNKILTGKHCSLHIIFHKQLPVCLSPDRKVVVFVWLLFKLLFFVSDLTVVFQSNDIFVCFSQQS